MGVQTLLILFDLRIKQFLFGRRTVGDKVHGPKGNSPARKLRFLKSVSVEEELYLELPRMQAWKQPSFKESVKAHWDFNSGYGSENVVELKHLPKLRITILQWQRNVQYLAEDNSGSIIEEIWSKNVWHEQLKVVWSLVNTTPESPRWICK